MIKIEIENLKNEINKHNYNYYVLDNPTISDFEYDNLFSRLKELEEKYGFFGDFSFVLETDGYTSFDEWLTPPAMRSFEIGNCRYLHGTHGYLPEKGPKPVFIGKGPSFRSNAVVPTASILRHAPTLAKVLGVTLNDTDEVAVKEILSKQD